MTLEEGSKTDLTHQDLQHQTSHLKFPAVIKKKNKQFTYFASCGDDTLA